MQNSYTNKIVLVTGGTSGIGKTTAIAFADAGARVVLTGRREKEGLEVVAEIKKSGGRLSRDYEYSVQTSETLIDIAATRLILNRLASA
jgi:NAD(P)-dependent dehydrogenase (short-subunit alcohol dehydrogenase family)